MDVVLLIAQIIRLFIKKKKKNYWLVCQAKGCTETIVLLKEKSGFYYSSR